MEANHNVGELTPQENTFSDLGVGPLFSWWTWISWVVEGHSTLSFLIFSSLGFSTKWSYCKHFLSSLGKATSPRDLAVMPPTHPSYPKS